jgi:hypothetical protein
VDRRLRFDALLLNVWGRAGRPAPSRHALVRRAVGPLLGVTLAACAGTLAATLRAPSRAPDVPGTFECALEELKALGYGPTAFDRDAGRLTAQKADPTARRPRTTFRRVLDRIEVDAVGGELVVRARTMVEFDSHRGPTEEEETASATARAAARTLIERCGIPAGR